MRLWTLHPSHLDVRGISGLWAESALALKVVRGETRGYSAHPQLDRFNRRPDPVQAMIAYRGPVYDDAIARGIRVRWPERDTVIEVEPIDVTDGQVRYERWLLSRKLATRSSGALRQVSIEAGHSPLLDLHPLFRVVPGDVAAWERPLPDFEPERLP